MIVVKIRKPFLIGLSWRPSEEWLWVANVSIDDGYTAPTEYQTLGYPFENYNTTATEIGQCYVDDISYESTASIASCKAIEKSWYFDVATQKLYIHVAHGKRMDASDFDSLETSGYSSGFVFYDENNFKFLPYVTSDNSISDEVDRSVFEKMSFTDNTITFHNQTDEDGEGEFDYALTSKVPGSDVNIYYIKDTDVRDGKKSLTPLYTGYVQADDLKAESYSITVADKREQLNTECPTTTFDPDTYPNMDDDLNELIPEGYGNLTGVPAFCTNDTVETGEVTYKYATDGTSLTTVYAYDDDTEEWGEVTPTASDGEACTFTLSSTDGRDDSDNPKECKVDCRLRDYDSPAEIIADMLNRYLDYPFNADYFDFQTWTDEASLLGDVALYMDETEEFFEWIELLQNGSTLPFVFRVNADGKFQIIVDDITRTISEEYSHWDNVNDDRRVETDFTQYATEVTIYHSEDQESEEYASETIETYKEETIDTYRVENVLEFYTLLTSSADAQTRGENILKDYKEARGLHTITLDGIHPTDLLDVVTYDSSIYKGIEKIREYAGTVKLKIASYSYDFSNDQTTLTGYDISDITSKGTEIITTGMVNGKTNVNGFMTVNGPTETYQPEVG